MITSGDHVAVLDAEDIIEDVELFVAIGTKMNLRKWVKKSESQVGEIDQLKLKTDVLHGDKDVEVHMAQLDEFVAAELVSVG